MLSVAQFKKVLAKAFNHFQLDDPAKSYWACSEFSFAAYSVADEFKVPSVEVVHCVVKYQQAIGEIKIGDSVNHTLLMIDGYFHDYTSSQVTTKANAPIIAKKLPDFYSNISKHKSSSFSGDPTWYNKYHEFLWLECDRVLNS